jgi:hypothetical protein
MKKTSNGVRLISIILAVLIILQIPSPALAYMVNGSDAASGITFTDSDGNTHLVDESWEERYPYGVFAFEKSGLSINEGESDIIKVYRLGGSAGRARAYITYEPVLVQDEEGNTIYDNAISADDLDIAVEEPIPLAQYQPIGKDEAPASGKAFVLAEKDETDKIVETDEIVETDDIAEADEMDEADEADETDEMDEADETDETGYIIKLSQEADAYQWQILYKGSWKDITDAESAEFPADAEFVEDGTYDYRCFYTLGDSQFCSVSLKGQVYEPAEEEYIPDLPDDIEINAKPEYTKLNLRGEGEDPYAGWAFELIFADGEWVKEIHIDAFSDQLTEAQEAAAFTIRDCEGGEVLEAASTLLLTIADMNEPEPSTLGFVLSEIRVDKAEGKAKVMVERVGGNQRPVSIKYETQDGTALAGKDYEKTSSTLMFYAGVNKLPATVELIDDGLVSDEEVYFNIVLYELLGDDNCTLMDDQVRVNLINSGMGQEITALPNLASQLYDPEIIDVSGSLVEAEGAANSAGEPVIGTPIALEKPESVESDLIFGDSGDMSAQVYKPSLAKIIFNNPSNKWDEMVDTAQKKYWKLTHGSGIIYGKGETAPKVGQDYSGSTEEAISRGVAFVSFEEGHASLTESFWNDAGGSSATASQLFNRYIFFIKTRQGHDTAYLSGSTYLYSFTKPRLRFYVGNDMEKKRMVYNPLYVERFGSGPLNKTWTIRASDVNTGNMNDYDNPFYGSYHGDIHIQKEPLNLKMTLTYDTNKEHQKDKLNDASMVSLWYGELYRRTFGRNDAFWLEISTPNDSNTAPENSAVLSNYDSFKPKVEIISGGGGVTNDNKLYVGSTIQISKGNPPAGYDISNLIVYQSRDQGATWNVFNKFNVSESGNTYTIKLLGSGTDPLSNEDLAAQYKLRVAYQRTSTVNVDLAPSVPRVEGSAAAIDPSRRQEALTGYSGGSNYGFSQGSGVGSAITYGYNTFDSNSGDFITSYSERSVTKPLNASALTNSTEFSFSATNIQWVNFNLNADDLLLINGTAYPGNAKIYLKESDFAGGLSVLYYHKDYQTAQSAMKTAITWMAVYLDANGNGKIDGFFDEGNTSFTLSEEAGGKDEFMGYISPEAVNETQFAPVMRKGKYCQYFIKVCYTMTPRSLIMPEGANEGERAQILPAFTTAVNPDSAAYSKLTPETRAYRYIVSGLTRQRSGAAYTRSSDGHLKYGTKANENSILDIPLGGDFSPPVLSRDGKSYTWNPDFRGNILYPFEAPEPIVIENSIAGPTPITEDYSIDRNEDEMITGYRYNENGVGLGRMNGYLSSFTGTSTFAMVTQEQQATTEEIIEHSRPGVYLRGHNNWKDNGEHFYVQSHGVFYGVLPDSVTLSKYSTTPDAEYLKEVQKDDAPSSNIDMDDNKDSEMGEFNLDLGINLGAMEIAATEYVTIVLDENKIGFALGLPLGEVGIGKGSENESFTDKNKENWTQFKDFFDKSNFGGDDDFKKASQEHNRVKNKPLTPDKSKFQSKSFSVGFAVGIAFMFEYNPLDNGYYFEGMTVSFTVELSFRIQQRLTVCPIVYFYFEFKGEIEIGTGLGVIRDSVEEATPLHDSISAGSAKDPIDLKYKIDKGYEFETDTKAFNIRFNGKLAVDVYTKTDGKWKLADKNSGYIGGFISSDGTSTTQVVLKKQKDMGLEEEVTVLLRPLDYSDQYDNDVTSITYLARIENIRNEVYWKGIEISPSIALEVGAGVGVELLKLEIYAKIGLEATFLLGVYNMEHLEDSSVDKYEPASVESFGFSIGLGLRVVLLAFTFELDAVTYTVDYDGKEWETGWHFLNDWVEQNASDSGYMGVTIRPPRSSVNKQKLYAPEDNDNTNMGTQAYNPTDKNVPFQLSGYGTGVDAANLGRDMLYGSDYKVITAGERNFILYTVSRDGNNVAAEDVPQLVMSELTYKDTAPSGKQAEFKYGLANPAGSGGKLYLPVDVDNDSTGDLDFDAWVDESSDGTSTTYTINCTWVSYKNESYEKDYPKKPGGEPYTTATTAGAITGTAMNADNFKEIPRPDMSDTSYNLYDDWYHYYLSLENYNAYSQNRLKNAAKNTVLKKATWTYTRTPFAGEGDGAPDILNDSAFTLPEILYGDADTVNYLFAPGGGHAIFFGSTETLDTNNSNYKQYTDFLDANRMGGNNYDYLRSIKKSYLDVFGTRSNLNIVYKTSEGWKVASTALNTDGAMTNQTLSNVEFTKLSDGAYYVAYTTRQDAYEEISDKIDHLTVERLCLCKVTINEGGEAAWGAPYLLRMTKDYDNNNSKDGIYSTAGDCEKYESPYFSNLSFLTAKLDKDRLTGTEEDFSAMAIAEHTFLLFEMNGASYIILDDSLKTIVDSGKGTIHPFFTGQVQTNADGREAREASGKLEVTIGTDGNGGIFAVYVGSVPNTTNNALYLSAYDADTNSWSDGVMLAMRNMDTYEAAIRYDWGKFTTQAAYLGFKGEGSTKENGLLLQSDIGNLYGDAKDEILRNLRAYPNDMGDKNNLTFSNVQATKGSGGELLVVTRGSLTTLGLTSYENKNKTEYVVMPTYSEGGMESELGMYAISYSKGRANLGQGKISFNKPDFSMGSNLYVNISAVNTGDTAFRGSTNQPISAKLRAGDQKLAEWEIENNIRSGQTVVLEGFCQPLNTDLPEDTKFILEVSEDKSYTNGSQTKEIDLFTVEEYPDLAIENLEVSFAGISADGSKTTLNVDFVAANRGSGKVDGVYAQFTYADGKDTDDKTTYSVLDLSNSSLEIDQAKELETMAGQNSDANLKQGILYIYNAKDGNNDLEKGKGRRVHGTIEVPSEVFKSGEAGYLDLKIELFTGSDTITGMDAGVLNAEHNEYYSANNSQNKAIQASTSYTVAPSIVIPLGTTTLIPVTAVSSRGTKPALSVTEIDDINDGLNLGILNFKQTGTQTGGSVSGVLSITPSKEGSGIIHIYDADTESQIAVAFIVTDSEDGIDIFIDNEAFTFINADGSSYDPDKTGQSWHFNSAPTWGEGANKETPLRSNLSMGEKDASFTFSTVAEKIDLYFRGKVTVTSDYPGHTAHTYTNDNGGKTPTKIIEVTNEKYAAYSVTVKVDSPSASFDRIVEYYSKGEVPTPEYDGQNPMFIWSRSFPATASIKAGSETIALSLYVLDNNGLQYISINGKQYDAGNSSLTAINDRLLWRYDFGNIASNGNYDIIAKDISGNTVSTVLMVDWFHESPSGNEGTVDVPLYDANFYIGRDEWNDTAIGKNEIGALNISFTEETGNKKGAVNTHEAYLFDGSKFEKLETNSFEEPSVFSINANGIYWTRTVNGDSTWSAKVLYMGKIDESLPRATISFDENSKSLLWSAYKEIGSLMSEGAGIDTVTINGFKVNQGTSNNHSGVFPVYYGGTYELKAKDRAENEIISRTTVSKLDIDLSGCTITSAASTNPDRTKGNGSVSVDLTDAVGGSYYTADSDTAQNEYYARYQMALAAGEYNLDNIADDSTLEWKEMYMGNFTHTYESLNPGEYTVIVRDMTDNSNLASLMITVADEVPQVEMSYENGMLSWQAYKTAGAKHDIAKVTVNGYAVNISEGLNLNGTLQIEHKGSYELVAEDTVGNTDRTVITVTSLGIDLSKSSITPNEAWNQERNNGYISINLTNAAGGAYNISDSIKENNEYYARYQMALISDDYDLGAPGWDKDLSWINMNKNEGFTHTFEALASGDYKLIVRDAADTSNYGSMMITVTDRAITVLIDSLAAGSYYASDGQITASVENGVTQGFEFALMPIKDHTNEKLYTIGDFLALDTAESSEDDIVWNLGDDVSLNPFIKTFAALGRGWYLIAVRGLYGVSAEQFEELEDISGKLAKARLALDSAGLGATEDQKKAVEDAKAAYDNKAQEIQELSDTAYADFGEYWDGAYVTAIEVNSPGLSNASNLSRIISDNKGAKVFTLLSPYKHLAEADIKKVISANKEDDIIITGGGLTLRIPKGTLRDGFDVNRMIVDLAGAAEGKLVQYTDLDGNVSILPWCLVSGESVSYLIIGLGDYKLTDKPVNFDDIEVEWGAEYIIFTAARNLFSGTGENTFSPHVPMTRSMFVTVLWRLAGSPQAEGDQPFNDLGADWYRDAVLWAVQKGIVSGYSNEIFGPDDIVSREQMCVFLSRFLKYLGMNLDEDDRDLAFDDDDKISSWASEYVYMCAKTGLIQGVGENTFDPLKGASRMEVSTILTRFITEIVKKYGKK